jgi:CubicO group peptidase (beta-lactamase class C family)
LTGRPEPGEVYAYSNTDYLLLGQIIEKVTGLPYGREIQRRIIQPLRLRGTAPNFRGEYAAVDALLNKALCP